jgi:hypothetical protein
LKVLSRTNCIDKEFKLHVYKSQKHFSRNHSEETKENVYFLYGSKGTFSLKAKTPFFRNKIISKKAIGTSKKLRNEKSGWNKEY